MQELDEKDDEIIRIKADHDKIKVSHVTIMYIGCIYHVTIM